MKRQWKVKYHTVNIYGEVETLTTSAEGRTIDAAYLDAARMLNAWYAPGNNENVAGWAISEITWLPEYGEGEEALFDED